MYLLVLFTTLTTAYGNPLTNTQDAEPSFCHKLDCPKFSVVESFKTYELREYEPSMWVATNITTMTFSDADNIAMFDKLFNYISGNNADKQKIPMTAPVLNSVLHGQGPDCESTFTMHFMMPFDLQAKPPAPTDPKVYITTLPDMKVYIRTYGGYSNGSAVQENLAQLADDIGDNSKFISNPYHYAGYDNPYQVLDRHNEIWLQTSSKDE